MKISKDKFVTFHYSLLNDQKELLDDSRESEPLPYLHGHSNILPGLEQALEGKQVGDQLEVNLSAEQAYGLPDESLIMQMDAAEFINMPDLSVGAHCQMEDEQGNLQVVKVTAIDDKYVTVDGNHPLVGQALTFVVDVVEVRDATADELSQGHVKQS